MVAPGILVARYERLAGDENRRLEAYIARTKLGYGITEWRELPWWHRRLYLEQLEAEANRVPGGNNQAEGPSNIADALLSGSMDDVGGLGFGAD